MGFQFQIPFLSEAGLSSTHLLFWVDGALLCSSSFVGVEAFGLDRNGDNDIRLDRGLGLRLRSDLSSLISSKIGGTSVRGRTREAVLRAVDEEVCALYMESLSCSSSCRI